MERRLAPVPERPVEVVGILAGPAVEAHQSRAVQSASAAGRSVVAQPVDPPPPQQRIGRQPAGILLVETGLPPLGQFQRAPCGTFVAVGLLIGEPFESVADGRSKVAPLAGQLLQPEVHILHQPAGPARLLPPDHPVRKEVERPVLAARHHRGARGIDRPGRPVEPAHVVGQVLVDTAQVGEEPPHHHRGVVDMLGHDLLQQPFAVLLEGGRSEVAHVREERGAQERQVDPNEHALPVAPVVKRLQMGCGRRTDGIGPQIAGQFEIGSGLAVAPQRSDIGPVVGQRNAPQVDPFTVQEQPLRRELHAAQPRRHLHAVRAFGGRHLRLEAVQCRRFGRPELRLKNREGDRERFRAVIRTFQGPVLAEKQAVLRVERPQGHLDGAGRGDREMQFGVALDPLFGDLRSMDQQSVRTQVEGRNGHRIGYQQLHAADDAAVEVPLGGRHQVAARGIGYQHQQLVVRAEADEVGDLESEGDARTDVVAGMVAVDEEVGRVLDPRETEEEPFPAPVGRDIEAAGVDGLRALVGVDARQRIEIPGVGQRDGAGPVAAVFVDEEERPAVVERAGRARLRTARQGGKGQQQEEDSFHVDTLIILSLSDKGGEALRQQIAAEEEPHVDQGGQQEGLRTGLTELVEAGLGAQRSHSHRKHEVVGVVDRVDGRHGQQIERVEADDGQKSEGEPGNGDLSAARLGARPAGGTGQQPAHDEQHGGQHDDADHLDDDGRRGHRIAHRVAGTDHVGHLVQRRSRIESHLFGRQVESARAPQSRVEEHGEGAEDDDRRHRHGGLVRLGLDDGFGAQHGGGAANGASGRRQQGQVPVHLQQASEQDAQQQGADHDDRIDRDGRKTDGDHALEGQAESVEHDAGPQQLLGAEADARNPGFGQAVAQAVRIEHAEQNAHDQGAERQLLHERDVGQIEGRAGEEGDEQHAVQHVAFRFAEHHFFHSVFTLQS